MRRMVFASNNRGKVRELGQMFAGLDIELLPQSEFGVPEVEETGLTFVENALLKARAASRHTALPAIGDDSGLAVDALGGAPGIYSARYAGVGASDADNNAKLLSSLACVPAEARGARFHCVLVFLRHAEDPTPLIFDGRCEGRVLEAPRGANGFGYDPLLYLPELGLSMAELSPEEKNRVSHRGKAVRQLLTALRES